MADLLRLADRVLAGARAAEDVEVYAVHRLVTTVQAGTGGVVRSVSRAETRGLGVRLIADHRRGYASTSDLGDASLVLTLERARANARLGDPDETEQLPTPTGVDVDPPAQADRLTAVPLRDKVELARRLAHLIPSLDPRVTGTDTAEYRDEHAEITLASTRGVRVQMTRESAELWGDALAEDEHGRVADEACWCGSDPMLLDVEALAAQAVQRTVRLLGPPAPVVRDLPVVLDRNVVATLLAAVGKGCTGGALASGRSPFARSDGAAVAAPCVTLLDDGTAVDALAAAGPYDDEGVARRRTELITGGRLAGALHSTSSALGSGREARSTGNARRSSHKNAPRVAPTSLRLVPTTSRELAGLRDAVHVQQLAGAGTGISALTGRVDVGCVGWRIIDGAPAGRIPTTPLSTSLPALLRAVVEVADDAQLVPPTPVRAPTVLCDGGSFWRT